MQQGLPGEGCMGVTVPNSHTFFFAICEYVHTLYMCECTVYMHVKQWYMYDLDRC